MKNKDKTKEQLIHELVGLRKRIAALEASEAKRNEMMESLSECKDNYYDFFKNTKDALYITDRNGGFIDVNQSFLDLFEYTRKELENLKAQETYVNYTDRYGFQQEIEHRGFVRDYVMKLRKKDGTELDCQVSATVRRTNDGSVLGYRGIIRDVTEQRKTEEALSESEEKFRTFMETASDLMDITDKDLNLTYVNESMARTLGYSKEEMIGMHMTQILRMDDLKKFKQKMEKLVAKGEITFETTWLAKKRGRDSR